jgi:DNA-binding response OmpR family regulator
MDKIKILLIEDEVIVSDNLKSILEKLNYEVVAIAANAKEAYAAAYKNKVDLVISDIQIEGPEDGIEVAKVFQETYNLPIIFMTAFNDDQKINRVSELTNLVGYLVKPIRITELNTLIKIAIAKFKIIEKSKQKIISNVYKYDFDTKAIYENDQEISLTKNEKLLVSLLLTSKEQVVSNEAVNYAIWKNSEGSDLSRRQLIHRVKSKLPNLEIFSVKGIGIGIKE